MALGLFVDLMVVTIWMFFALYDRWDVVPELRLTMHVFDCLLCKKFTIEYFTWCNKWGQGSQLAEIFQWMTEDKSSSCMFEKKLVSERRKHKKNDPERLFEKSTMLGKYPVCVTDGRSSS